MKKAFLLTSIIALFMLTIFAMTAQTAAFAADRPSEQRGPDVIGFNQVFIPPDALVDHVVIIGSDATIAGTVTNEVLVINGTLTLLPTAKLEKRAFILGGHFIGADGAVVKKGIVNLETGSANMTSLFLTALLMLFWGFVKIVISIILVIILPILSWSFPVRCQRLAAVCRADSGKAAALGVLVGLAFLLLEMLLLISIVGIPLALLLGLLFVLVAIFGVSGVCQAVGGKLAAKMGESDKPAWIQAFYGILAIVLIANIPFLGPMFLLFILLLGIGVLALTFTQKSNTMN